MRDASNLGSREHRFSAVSPGSAAVPVDDLLNLVEDLVARVGPCFGLGREDFENDVEPLQLGW